MLEKKPKRLLALDAFRGLAALAVVLFHYTMFTPQAELGFKYGVTGVDIFFLFSGFVVLLSFKESNTIRQLVVGRIARLYPAYWIAVLFTGFLFWYYNVHTADQLHEFKITLVANLSMLQYYFQRPNLDGPYWTMKYEVLFFAFMLLVFAFKCIKHIEWVALVGILFTALYSLIFKSFCVSWFLILQNWVPILSHFALFMAGIIFYKIRTEGANLQRIIMVFLAYLVQLSCFENGGRSKFFITFEAYFIILTVYFIILFLLIYDRLNFLANAPLLFLGSISYPLFLIHQFLSRSVIIAVLVTYEHYSFWASAAIALLVCVCLATIITRYLEKPIGDWIKTIGGIK